MEIDGFWERLQALIGKEAPYGWAARMGISKGAFTRIYKDGGLPGADMLVRIKRGSGVSLDWLLTGDGSPPDEVMKIDHLKRSLHLALIEGNDKQVEHLERQIAEVEERYQRETFYAEAREPYDREALEIALECADLYIRETGSTLTPRKTARLVRILYEQIALDHETPSKGKVIDLIKLAADEKEDAHATDTYKEGGLVGANKKIR